jgi:hypothetical protein
LRITGLPLAVIDDTVRVEVEGPAVATNVRAGLDAPPPETAAGEETPELRAVRREVALAEAEIERITAALERAGASSIVEADPGEEPAAWSAIVTARRAVIALRTERELVLREELSAARRKLEDARRARDAAIDRDRRTGTERPAKQHELRKYVDIELVASGASAPVTVRLEYLVVAARWAPTYVARLDGEQVSVEVRAVVAQNAGEDWTSVPLRLSTAEPSRFATLPELAAQRIGRRQQEPGRAGFRAPPVGADGLYADFDREVAQRRRAEDASRSREPGGEVFDAKTKPYDVVPRDDLTYDGRPQEQQAFAEKAGRLRSPTLAEEVWDEASSHAKEAFSTPASGGRPMPKAPAPMQPQSNTRSAAPERAKGGLYSDELGGAASVEKSIAPPPHQAPVARLDYANLVMAPPSSGSRGRLISPPHDARRNAIESDVATADANLASLVLPRGCVADWVHTYDYAFATDGAIDVRADGAWHSIAVTARPSSAKLHHVSVPREQADVFRVAAIPNPFAGPLLPGPIDVYDRGRFLVTSAVDYTPPGATLDIGLGVDPTVKIARNTEFREEATGMLRGALRLHHAVTIDVDNVSTRAIDLEVRERIPVAREGDDDIEVTVGKIEPAWERWTPDPNAPREQRLRGGHRWRLAVPAGQKRTLRAAYEVKIAGKLELVGGNRREP